MALISPAGVLEVARVAPSEIPMGESRFWILLTGVVFLVVTALFLHSRNIYEDEVLSFRLIPEPVRAIWADANSTDVHPPGMYVISSLFYLVTGSERWMGVGPALVLFTGLMVFAFSASRQTVFSRPSLITFLLLALMHPQLLMWANSVRWYPYWTSAALVATAFALQISRPYNSGKPCPPLSRRAAAALGVLLGAMFYLSYLTLLFLCALVVAYLLRYPFRRPYLSRIALTAAVFCVTALAQAVPFFHVHLAHRESQHAPVSIAFLRLCHGLFLSEALFPWHPAGALFLIFFIVPVLYLQVKAIARESAQPSGSGGHPIWVCLFAFLGVLFTLGCLTGTGSKPRTFLILCPIVAFLAATVINRIHRMGLQYALLGLAVLWIVSGSNNLIARQGTAKGGMNDHPEEVVKLVHEHAHGKCAVIFTSEPALTFVLNEAAKSEPWTVTSVFPDYPHDKRPASAPACAPETAFVVQSYVGALHEHKEQLQAALSQARNAIAVVDTAQCSRDKDLYFKQRIPGFKQNTADLPEYRFVVQFGPVKPDVNWPRIAAAFDFYQPPEWRGILEQKSAARLNVPRL